MNKILLFLFIIFSSVKMFGQDYSQNNYTANSQDQINKNIQNLYKQLNEIKTEVRRLKGVINEIDTENLTRRWVDRKEFIFGNYDTIIRGIESSIEIIPKAGNQSDQIIWSGKVSNMINSFNDDLNEARSDNGILVKLIEDQASNTVIFKQKNIPLLSYDDLMYYVTKKTGKNKLQIESDAKRLGYKYNRDYIIEIAKNHME